MSGFLNSQIAKDEEEQAQKDALAEEEKKRTIKIAQLQAQRDLAYDERTAMANLLNEYSAMIVNLRIELAVCELRIRQLVLEANENAGN